LSPSYDKEDCGEENDKSSDDMMDVQWKNYRSTFIESIRTFTFKDHIATDMHQQVISLEVKENSTSVMEYVCTNSEGDTSYKPQQGC